MYEVESEGIAVFRAFDSYEAIEYTGTGQDTDLFQWLSMNEIPTGIFEFTEDYVETIFVHKRPVIMLFDQDDSPYKSLLEEVSLNLQGTILFATADLTEHAQQMIAEMAGIKQLPQLVIFDPLEQGMKKFVYEDDLTQLSVDAIKKFIADFKAGTLEPSYRSQEVPAGNNDGPLKVVVGSTYDYEVLAENREVIVWHYADELMRHHWN